MKFISNIFWNTGQSRLRTGWRLLIQLIPFLAITGGRDHLISMARPNPFLLILAYLIYLAGGVGVVWVMTRFFDHRSFADLGFHFNRKWWLDSAFGLILGAFLVTGIFLSMKAAGWVVIIGTAVTTSGLPFILAFFLRIIFFTAAAVNEELTFRGYQLKNLSEGFSGRRISPRSAVISAFVVSSALFGLSHLANENATLLSTLIITISGLVLSLPYLLTGELAISIGLHLTWNLFESSIYGFSVSGFSPGTSLFSLQQTGPDLWTGGLFGPEVGLIGLIWAMIGCGMILLWIKVMRKKIELNIPLATYTPRQRKGPVEGYDLIG